MKILFIGDIVGTPGQIAVAKVLQNSEFRIKNSELNVDFIIANGECANKNGQGIKQEDVKELTTMGVDCITSGERVWNEKETFAFLKTNPSNLLRPLNYPPGVPGLGSFIYPNGVGVVNLLGRSFLANIDCPFRIGLDEVKKLKAKTKIIIIDFHGQTTAEKQAFTWWIDGKVSAVIGTHTFAPTGDMKIFHKGTAYVTSVGMTGVQDAIGGMQKDLYIDYFLNNIPVKFKPAQGEGKVNAVILEIDDTTGKALKIERL